MWRCPYCETYNEDTEKVCYVCGIPRAEVSAENTEPKKSAPKSDFKKYIDDKGRGELGTAGKFHPGLTRDDDIEIDESPLSRVAFWICKFLIVTGIIVAISLVKAGK